MTMSLTDTAVRLIVCPRCEAGPRVWCITITGNRARYPHSARTEPLYEAWRDGYAEAERSVAHYARSLAERDKTGRQVAALLERAAGI